MESFYCLRCNREIEPGDKSVAVYMFAQTVGIRPRQKSSAQRICFCPQCSVSLAMGPAPEGALNLVMDGCTVIGQKRLFLVETGGPQAEMERYKGTLDWMQATLKLD